MKTITFTDQQDWLDARKRRITGSKLYDTVTLRGNGKKKGYYELIADRMSLPATGENPMDRGHRLEPEAIKVFEAETKKEVNTDFVMWMRDDDENIAISPDGYIGETEAVEVKCWDSANHIKVLLEQKLETKEGLQALQYFIVNDKLETLYFCFYDPRLIAKQFFYLTINRTDVEENIEKYLTYERELLAEVNEIVTSLTF